VCYWASTDEPGDARRSASVSIYVPSLCCMMLPLAAAGAMAHSSGASSAWVGKQPAWKQGPCGSRAPGAGGGEGQQSLLPRQPHQQTCPFVIVSSPAWLYGPAAAGAGTQGAIKAEEEQRLVEPVCRPRHGHSCRAGGAVGASAGC
jgi:hypothetical protein